MSTGKASEQDGTYHNEQKPTDTDTIKNKQEPAGGEQAREPGKPSETETEIYHSAYSRITQVMSSEDERQVFGRRSSIARTPPGSTKGSHESLSSKLPDSGGDLPSSETDRETANRPTKKRKTKSSPPIEREVVSSAQTKLTRVIGDLSAFTKKNTNVHKEIKKMALELASLIGKGAADQRWQERYRAAEGGQREVINPGYGTEAQRTLVTENKRLHEEVERLRKVIESLKEGEDARARGTCSCNKGEGVPPNGDDQAKIRNALENQDRTSFQEIISLEWKEDIYRNTALKVGNPLKESKGADLALLREGNAQQPDKVSSILRMFSDRFPEIENIPTGANGACTALANTSRIIRANEAEPQTRESFLYVGDIMDEQSIYEFLMNLKSFMARYDRKKVAIPRIERLTPERFRKIVEFLFHGSEMVIEIYTPASEVNRGEEDKGTTTRRGRAIIIESQGKEYPDLLKEVKNSLMEGPEITLRGIRKTKQGNLLLEVVGDDNNQTQEVAKSIQNNVRGVKLRVTAEVGKVKQIQIKDMDLLTTEEEVRNSILKEVPDDTAQTDIRVISLSDTEDGRRTARVEINTDLAETMVQKGFIKVGLVRARVRGWQTVSKCYKCWEMGHMAANCKGTDRSRLCHRCGKEGHDAKACSEDMYCPLCQREGHRAGGYGCQTTYRMIREVKRKSKKHW